MPEFAFIIPSTTNKRDEWKQAEDTYLWTILCSSLEKYTPDIGPRRIKLFIGYDEDDRIYSLVNERMKFKAVFMKFDIEWFPQPVCLKGKLSTIWNNLGREAIVQGYDYIKILGDDIRMPSDTGWLGHFHNKLKKNNNIGWSAGFSNNDNIPTQFLVHKTHFEIFNFFYPEEIPTWGVDDFLYQVYPAKYRNWMKSYPLFNVGGAPRYEITFSEKFVKAIVKRYRPKLNRHLQQLNE